MDCSTSQADLRPPFALVPGKRPEQIDAANADERFALVELDGAFIEEATTHSDAPGDWCGAGISVQASRSERIYLGVVICSGGDIRW